MSVQEGSLVALTGVRKVALAADRAIAVATRAAGAGAMSVTIVMMFVVAGDGLMRVVFNHPLAGPHELMEFAMVVLVFPSLAYTALQKGHVAVDLLVERFPEGLQGLFTCLANLLSLGICSLYTWQSVVFAIHQHEKGLVSSTLGVPVYPFAWMVALGFALLCLVLLSDTVKSLWRLVRT